MSDVLTPSQRSFCMARNRAKNTKPEIALRSSLWRRGLRFRVHYSLIGRPDVVFTKSSLAVFVDGCFWHSCPEHGAKPKANAEFWNAKLTRNKQRDVEVTHRLRLKGWTVLRFWEHEIRNDVEQIATAIEAVVRKTER